MTLFNKVPGHFGQTEKLTTFVVKVIPADKFTRNPPPASPAPGISLSEGMFSEVGPVRGYCHRLMG